MILEYEIQFVSLWNSVYIAQSLKLASTFDPYSNNILLSDFYHFKLINLPHTSRKAFEKKTLSQYMEFI